MTLKPIEKLFIVCISVLVSFLFLIRMNTPLKVKIIDCHQRTHVEHKHKVKSPPVEDVSAEDQNETDQTISKTETVPISD
jgi:hypothetical protein